MRESLLFSMGKKKKLKGDLTVAFQYLRRRSINGDFNSLFPPRMYSGRTRGNNFKVATGRTYMFPSWKCSRLCCMGFWQPNPVKKIPAKRDIDLTGFKGHSKPKMLYDFTIL